MCYHKWLHDHLYDLIAYTCKGLWRRRAKGLWTLEGARLLPSVIGTPGYSSKYCKETHL